MDRGARSAAAPRRARLLLAGALVLAVLGAAAFVLSRDLFPSSQADGATTTSAQATETPADSAIAMSSAVVTVPPNRQAPTSSSPAKTSAAHPSATGPTRPTGTGTGTAIAQLAVGLTQSMLDEQPPDDGHRMNILSTAYTHVGIAVYRDSAGTVWLTQDFSN